MYLAILGLIALGAGLLLVYYSLKGKMPKKEVDNNNSEPEDKGKVIYLFDEEEDKVDESEDKVTNDDSNNVDDKKEDNKNDGDEK